MMERWHEFEGGIPRAPRFAFQVPIRYRTTGALAWETSQAANISRSGVLFVAHEPLALDTSIELSFYLPVHIAGEAPASVICQGRIVRYAAEDDTDDGVPVAATIESYRFERTRGSSRRGKPRKAAREAQGPD